MLGIEIFKDDSVLERRDDPQAAGRVQVADIQEETSKESQGWEAWAAKEVAAARARGVDLEALVDRKQQYAEDLRRKAEQKQAEAAASSKPLSLGLDEAADVAEAKVPSQHLPAFSRVAFVLSGEFYRERERMSSTVLPDHEIVTAARGSRLAGAAGVDDVGHLTNISAFPLHFSSAAARQWQQVPRGTFEFERLVHVSGLYEWRSYCFCGYVVPAFCFDGEGSERHTASQFRLPRSLDYAVA